MLLQTSRTAAGRTLPEGEEAAFRPRARVGLGAGEEAGNPRNRQGVVARMRCRAHRCHKQARATRNANPFGIPTRDGKRFAQRLCAVKRGEALVHFYFVRGHRVPICSPFQQADLFRKQFPQSVSGHNPRPAPGHCHRRDQAPRFLLDVRHESATRICRRLCTPRVRQIVLSGRCMDREGRWSNHKQTCGLQVALMTEFLPSLASTCFCNTPTMGFPAPSTHCRIAGGSMCHMAAPLRSCQHRSRGAAGRQASRRCPQKGRAAVGRPGAASWHQAQPSGPMAGDERAGCVAYPQDWGPLAREPRPATRGHGAVHPRDIEYRGEVVRRGQAKGRKARNEAAAGEGTSADSVADRWGPRQRNRSFLRAPGAVHGLQRLRCEALASPAP